MNDNFTNLIQQCKIFSEAVEALENARGDGERSAVAAVVMLLAAREVTSGKYRQNTLNVLDALALAKAKLDSVVYHLTPVVLVSAEILAAAQVYVEENTISCTEWPTSDEVVAFVESIVSKYFNAVNNPRE